MIKADKKGQANIPLKRAPGFEEPRMHGPGSGMTSGWAHFKEKAWAEGWKSQSSDYTVRYGNDKAGTWRKGKGLTGKKGRKEVGLVESEPTRRITKKQEREASTGEWRALQGVLMSVLEKEVKNLKEKDVGKKQLEDQGRKRKERPTQVTTDIVNIQKPQGGNQLGRVIIAGPTKASIDALASQRRMKLWEGKRQAGGVEFTLVLTLK
ncbi:hypothetical protein BY996DRAFT_6507053 [Phakopsora pachyrhizi]|nr:hypothetical protein BY996DRAFT_6507053 [Phakopsora pachyrhizi]